MNADLRTTLLREPRPGDANDVRVGMDGGGWRLAWQRDGGRRPELFGPIFVHVSHAAAAAREVRQAHGLG